MREPEFVRSNQKSYLRIKCQDDIMQSYEYQMCQHNRIHSFLLFQQRNQNGEQYLYFEVSGMQSLDIFLQTQKLKRDFAVKLANAIVKLCSELGEYALSIEHVDFQPRYIMISANCEEMRFLYSFHDEGKKYTKVEQLLECCIENLDYGDELLTEKFYQIYERLLEQEDNFFLAGEMEAFLAGITNEKEVIIEEISMEEGEEAVVDIPEKSAVAKREYRRLKQGLAGLLLLDAALLFLWKPINFLKIFFCIAVGEILFALLIYIWKQDKRQKKQKIELQQKQEFIQEYAELADYTGKAEDGTQIICIEDMEGILYNLQKSEPQYIHISTGGKIIGKDAQRAQVHIQHESISRIHALVGREGAECFVEDLNSTNGTRVNGKILEPRTRYVLKQGDKVCFADLEYIFR